MTSHFKLFSLARSWGSRNCEGGNLCHLKWRWCPPGCSGSVKSHCFRPVLVFYLHLSTAWGGILILLIKPGSLKSIAIPLQLSWLQAGRWWCQAFSSKREYYDSMILILYVSSFFSSTSICSPNFPGMLWEQCWDKKRLFQASLQPGEKKRELYLSQILQSAGSINVWISNKARRLYGFLKSL